MSFSIWFNFIISEDLMSILNVTLLGIILIALGLTFKYPIVNTESSYLNGISDIFVINCEALTNASERYLIEIVPSCPLSYYSYIKSFDPNNVLYKS